MASEKVTEEKNPPRAQIFRYFCTKIRTRLLVSGRSPECSDCRLRFMEQ